MIYIICTVHNNVYSDNFAALGVPPSKSHRNFIGYSDIIIGYSDNSCTEYTQILDFDLFWPTYFHILHYTSALRLLGCLAAEHDHTPTASRFVFGLYTSNIDYKA